MAEGETKPEQSKNEAFSKIEQPNTRGDFRMLMDIIPWRYILSKQPQIGTLSQKEDMEPMQNLWTPDDQRLLEQINKDIISVPTLTIPYTYRRFYIKTYWSKDGMGVVLLQIDDSVEAIKS